MELFDRPDFKSGLEILKRYNDVDELKNSIRQITDIEYVIGNDDIWGNIFTYNEIHILESNNFYYKNNNLIYIIC